MLSIIKVRKIALIAAVVAVLVLMGLWYYQRQGFIKIFPTREDRAVKKILTIDETKLKGPVGLTDEQAAAEKQKLYESRDKVLANQDDAKAWFDYGFSKEFWNDHESAVAAWERSFALQPLNFVTALNLGNTYQYFLKDAPRAEYYYEKVLELQPDYTSAHQGIIDLYRFNWPEKRGETERVVLRAIKGDPGNTVAYNVILVEFFALEGGNITKAKQYLEEVRRLKPEDAAELVANYPELQ